MTDLRIKTPCRMIITGPSQVGKSTFLVKLLQANQQCFTQPLGTIYWCAGILRQHEMQEIQKQLKDIKFIDGFPGKEIRDGTLIPKDKNACLVLDDLGDQLEKSPELKYIFTMMSHHDNINVFLLLQVLYTPNSFANKRNMYCYSMF